LTHRRAHDGVLAAKESLPVAWSVFAGRSALSELPVVEGLAILCAALVSGHKLKDLKIFIT
jgi:hypothetical protein